jgi:hypothetical protein
MDVSDLLIALHGCGVALSVVDGELRYRAPVGALTEDLRAAVREHRSEVIDLLSPPPPQAVTPGICSQCGQPSRVRCADVGRSGLWLAWCDDPTCGRADVVVLSRDQSSEVAQ